MIKNLRNLLFFLFIALLSVHKIASSEEVENSEIESIDYSEFSALYEQLDLEEEDKRYWLLQAELLIRKIDDALRRKEELGKIKDDEVTQYLSSLEISLKDLENHKIKYQEECEIDSDPMACDEVVRIEESINEQKNLIDNLKSL